LRAVLTVALDVLPATVQPEVGSVLEVLQAYSNLTAFAAVILPVSAPFELVRLVTLTVGAAAVPTDTLALFVPVSICSVPVSLLISLICELQSILVSLIGDAAFSGTVPVK